MSLDLSDEEAAALEPTPYSIKTDWGVGYQSLQHKISAEPTIGAVLPTGIAGIRCRQRASVKPYLSSRGGPGRRPLHSGRATPVSRANRTASSSPSLILLRGRRFILIGGKMNGAGLSAHALTLAQSPRICWLLAVGKRCEPTDADGRQRPSCTRSRP
jgi:hypothetical protein